MSEDIGVAVIGYGYWSPKLIRNITADRSLKLLAICEKDNTRHERIRSENPGVEVVKQYKDIFSRIDIKAIVIATVPSSHFRIAKQALESGKHVLIEKPMVLSVMEGEMLTHIAAKRSLTLMVDHTYLYSPAIQKMREIVAAGELGTLYSIESRRLNLGIFQRDVNVLWDLAPHDLSTLLFLLGQRPTHVSATASFTVASPKQEKPQESIAHLTLHFAGGLVAHVHVSWMSPIKVRQLTVVGSGKMMLFDQLATEQLTVFDAGVHPASDGGESGPLFEYKTGGPKPIPISEVGEDIARMFSDFAQCIRTGKTPVSNSSLGLDVVRILCAADRSLARGGSAVRISYITRPKGMLSLLEQYTRFRHGY